jgi:hypothetical protein
VSSAPARGRGQQPSRSAFLIVATIAIAFVGFNLLRVAQS